MGVYVKNECQVDETTLKPLNYSSHEFEMQWLIIKPPNQKTMVLGNIYRSPGPGQPKFLEHFSQALQTLDAHAGKDIHILGDFNIDVKGVKTNTVKELITMTRLAGLIQLIETPTRVTPSTATTIDLYFTNAEHIVASGSHPLNISDHDAIFLVRKKQSPPKVRTSFKGRIYKNYDSDHFQNEIRNRDWTQVMTADDCDLAWEALQGGIEEVLSRTCPVKMITLRKPQKPWLTVDILEQIKLKDDRMIEARASGDQALWIEAKRLRNRTKAMMGKAKAAYLQSVLTDTAKDSKAFWNTVHMILNPAKKSGQQINLLSNEGTPEPPGDAAETINDFFINVAHDLRKPNNVPWINGGPITDTNFSIGIPTYGELLKVLKKIDVNKSSGIDFLSSRVLKDAFLAAPHLLLRTIIISLTSGCFPGAWKRGTVIPIPKVANASTPSDHRPVALLPLPSKIIEKLVGAQTEHYLESNNLLTPHQFGFRKGRSTMGTVCELTDDIYKAMHKGLLTSAVFVDFRKAFDCVDHDILCSKLLNLGFAPNTLAWFRSYLTDRVQCTMANGVKSSLQGVRCGVPQGSILGPILFITFVNDLPDRLAHTKFKLYADDTLIYSMGKSYEENAISLNRDLSSLSDWCVNHRMFINYSKTKLLNFGSQGALTAAKAVTQVQIEGNPIQQVQTYKYLGVVLDPKLAFDNHVRKCVSTSSHKLSILRKVRPMLTRTAAVRIYKAMILPLLEYGDVLYGGAGKQTLKKLQVTQNRCLKLALALPKRTPTTQVHNEGSIGMLTERRDISVLMQAYERVCDGKLLDSRKLRTRKFDAPVLVVPRYLKDQPKRAVEYRSAVAWNNLPPDIRLAPSKPAFKRRLRSYYAAKRPPDNPDPVPD